MSNTETPHTDPNTTGAEPHDLVEALFSVGSAWARYGLGVAKLSLETSARTLGTTARALGDIAEKLDAARERKDDSHNVVETTGH